MNTSLKTGLCIALAGLLTRPAHGATPMATLRWRWGASSSPQKTQYAVHPVTSLFESDKTWGWKEWSIIVGSVAAVAGVVVVVANKSGGGGGSGGGVHY
jgi:hypothetical protein